VIEQLNSRYSRESENVDFEKMMKTTLIVVGTGAYGSAIEQFVRLGVKRIYLFDNDIVERKNLTSQNFTADDIGLQKCEALVLRLIACEFEKDNPSLPPLAVVTYGDFLAINDDELKRIIETELSLGQKIILIMASDYHPVQARGNRIAIKYKIPVFWVGIYGMGKAGEIIFYDPDFELPCYRCITETRYRFFDKNRLADHYRGDFRGAGKSSGLPSAASFIDTVLDHLVIGLIHREVSNNQHGMLISRLLDEGRNFIQCQLDPNYRLNANEDIFSQIKGPDMIAFNSIFQRENKNRDCPDCLPIRRGRQIWEHTDYTKENYKEILQRLSALETSVDNGRLYRHPLLKEYADLFSVWEKI
jgi:molybdopterin/thiamine biosynthesis adenylyltransferase